MKIKERISRKFGQVKKYLGSPEGKEFLNRAKYYSLAAVAGIATTTLPDLSNKLGQLIIEQTGLPMKMPEFGFYVVPANPSAFWGLGWVATLWFSGLAGASIAMQAHREEDPFVRKPEGFPVLIDNDRGMR